MTLEKSQQVEQQFKAAAILPGTGRYSKFHPNAQLGKIKQIKSISDSFLKRLWTVTSHFIRLLRLNFRKRKIALSFQSLLICVKTCRMPPNIFMQMIV